MKAYERLAAAPAQDRSKGWRTSPSSGGLGPTAWALAVAVVAVIAVGLYFLHG